MKKLIFALLLFACGAASGRGRGPVFTPADSPEIRFTGRAAKGPGGALSFDWSGSQFTFRFEGTRCAMRAADTGRNYYNVFVDGRHTGVAATSGADTTVVLAEGLERGPHTILVQKRTEGEQGRTTLRGVETDGALLPLPAPRTRHIEFIGDSHTCGYGTEGKSVEEPFTPETENCDLAWGCVIARYFDAEYTLIAHSGQGIVRNWGDEKEVSDCTMRERMLRTFDMDPASRWDFRGCTPDIVVIKLGSNDFSTGVTPSEQAFNASYAQALDQLRAAYGEVPERQHSDPALSGEFPPRAAGRASPPHGHASRHHRLGSRHGRQLPPQPPGTPQDGHGRHSLHRHDHGVGNARPECRIISRK